MAQQNYKMLAIWDRSYHSLDQLRSKYGSFNNVVSKLIEIYEEQEPQEKNESKEEAVSRAFKYSPLDCNEKLSSLKI